jgi:F-type H+-transporting ATPase subunit delta
MSEIVTLFDAMKANQEKRVDVEVISAYALEEAAEIKLKETLKKRLQRDVSLSSRVDQSLIGGLVLRTDDLVIDGSLRGRLNKLAEAMNS